MAKKIPSEILAEMVEEGFDELSEQIRELRSEEIRELRKDADAHLIRKKLAGKNLSRRETSREVHSEFHDLIPPY